MKKLLNTIFAAVLFTSATFSFAEPLSALKLYQRGLEKQEIEDFYGASEDFQQALQLNQSYGAAWFHLSEVTYSLGDYNLALTYLESADKCAKNRTDIQNLKGLCLISLGRFDEAKTVFSDILKVYPNDIDARFGLAELDLYSGSFIGAKNQYEAALKRQVNNRKALLSLALISAETEKNDVAKKYIDQALKFHSADPEVHYLAGYLEAKNGNLKEAERRIRSAIQIKPDWEKAYNLLASVLYAQKKYDEVIDISDYLISKDRENSQSWYMKGLSQYRKNDIEAAIETWADGIEINIHDEVMRSALELLAMKNLPVEDSRRAEWADYHSKKGREYAKTFMGEEARYEYQRALRLNPFDSKARSEFAELLTRQGLNENYLNQLKFIKNSKTQAENAKTEGKLNSAEETRVNDTIEAYDALMKYSLSAKWNVDPFYLDKTRWHLGIFYTKSKVQLVHSDAEEITASMAADVFTGIVATSVVVENKAVSGYGEAYRIARKNGLDYFIIISIDETDREIAIDSVVYSGRTGTETARFNSFRTGNQRFASVLRSFRRDILDILPVKGKIIDKTVNEVLVDLGAVEGMKKDAVLDVVKVGKIRTADKGLGIVYDEKDLLGKITLSRAGEEISQGTLEQNGFYDRVNIGDEVLIRSLPKAEGEVDGQIADSTPKAGENGKRILPENEKKKLNAEELGLVKTPVIIDLIRNIKN
ncbi:MAG: tetratricopeptide repeat protein [Treponema sp.]|nr:tetratricopeptide repeat protein [Candidatus Treponema equifaecale]